MTKKSNVEILCYEQIPALLRGAPPEEVFTKDWAYDPICQRDGKSAILGHPCRFGYLLVAQSSPKCTKEPESYDMIKLRITSGELELDIGGGLREMGIKGGYGPTLVKKY